MEVKPRLLKPDGGSQQLEPRNGTDFTVEELEALVGGRNLQIAKVARDKGYLISNWKTEKSDSNFNDEATLIYCMSRGFMDTIYGNAVLCPTEMFKNYYDTQKD